MDTLRKIQGLWGLYWSLFRRFPCLNATPCYPLCELIKDHVWNMLQINTNATSGLSQAQCSQKMQLQDLDCIEVRVRFRKSPRKTIGEAHAASPLPEILVYWSVPGCGLHWFTILVAGFLFPGHDFSTTKTADFGYGFSLFWSFPWCLVGTLRSLNPFPRSYCIPDMVSNLFVETTEQLLFPSLSILASYLWCSPSQTWMPSRFLSA